jgi:4a-hydroxytetrahydrobiopterin dehydratase
MKQKILPLSEKKCTACRGGVPPLSKEESNHLLQELNPDWKIVKLHHLEREYIFPDFRHALNFVNLVGQIAESEGHHPDIYLSWGKVKLTIWTHKIDGLTESDFILAAKADSAYPKSREEAAF